MSKQSTFDVVVKKMREQNWERATGPGGMCMYRDPQGRCCAVGALMTDEEAVLAGGTRFAYLTNAAEIATRNGVDVGFLLGLQTLHDTSIGGESMLRAFEEFAERHGLEMPNV